MTPRSKNEIQRVSIPKQPKEMLLRWNDIRLMRNDDAQPRQDTTNRTDHRNKISDKILSLLILSGLLLELNVLDADPTLKWELAPQSSTRELLANLYPVLVDTLFKVQFPCQSRCSLIISMTCFAGAGAFWKN